MDSESEVAAGLGTNSTLIGRSVTVTLKPGAETVIEWSEDGTPMTVTYDYGEGRVVYFNDVDAAFQNANWNGDTPYGTALMHNAVEYVGDGPSNDGNGNDIPDDCEMAVPRRAPDQARKNRYISFDPNNGTTVVAFEVTLSDGRTCWVGEPCLRADTNNVDPQWIAECVESAAGDGSDMVRDWSSYTDPSTGDPVVHVRGCVIMPNETYDVRPIAIGGALTPPLTLGTVSTPTISGSWADCVGDFNAGSGQWDPPDGNTSFKDIAAGVQGFQQALTAPVTWLDLVPGGEDEANYVINFADIGAIIQGFQNEPYLGSVAGCAIPATADACP